MPATGRSAIERSFFFKASANVQVKQTDGSSVDDKRPISGFFHMNALVAKSFLDIPEQTGLPPADAELQIEASTRTLALIGGGEGTSDVKAHGRKKGRGGKSGTKTVYLFTGRPTKQGAKRKSTISIRFPSWATAKMIGEALAEVIPTSKISSTPGATEIRPIYKVGKGLVYNLPSQTVATTSAAVAVPVSQAESETVAEETKEGTGKK